MARPKKQTVDYFPHIIKKGKTMTILENKFGNDGYAFWFKLLEILGSTDGHYYEYRNTTDKEFLHAKTLVSEDTAKKILDLLAKLNAIDQELWNQKVIWCDNFIDNIEDAYSRRKVNVPHKPEVSEVNVNINPSEQDKCEHDDDINSQSKVNKSKLDKSREELNISAAEKKVLNILKSVEKYPFDYEKDLEYIRELTTDYPGVDLLGELKKWHTYKKDKPLKEKSNARLQVRNWIENAKKWNKEKENDYSIADF